MNFKKMIKKADFRDFFAYFLSFGGFICMALLQTTFEKGHNGVLSEKHTYFRFFQVYDVT